MKEIYDLLNKYEAILAENKESIHNNKNKKMKGKNKFTEAEISKLKMLIKERCNAPSGKQKSIRDKMRRIGFYGGDDFYIKDMTVEKFENLIRDGRIKIIKGEAVIPQDNVKKQMQTTLQEEMIESFPPLIDENSEILIVGTMPGTESLREGEYYASNSNSFWKIIDKLLNNGKGFGNYQEKVACLKEHHIALWDVIASCERQGSADNNISDVKLNDIDNLHKQYPRIRKIICNGKKAAEYLMVNGIESVKAESTSNANAKPLDIKIEDWKSKLEI